MSSLFLVAAGKERYWQIYESSHYPKCPNLEKLMIGVLPAGGGGHEGNLGFINSRQGTGIAEIRCHKTEKYCWLKCRRDFYYESPEMQGDTAGVNKGYKCENWVFEID